MGKEISLVTLNLVDEEDKSERVMFHRYGDNNIEIEELLMDLNIIDDFDKDKKEKVLELAMALMSHKGEINILNE